MTVGELKEENAQLKTQLGQAAQMLQNNDLAGRTFELDRIKTLIGMYGILLNGGAAQETVDMYFNDITASLVRVPTDVSGEDFEIGPETESVEVTQ